MNNQFPLLSACTYVNTPSSGILSNSLLAWRRQHDLAFFEQGSVFRNHHAEFLQEVKRTVANFFTAKPENTLLVPNFSFAFNTVLEGLPSSHRFLLVEEEYPSINYAVESRGFPCHSIPCDANLEDNILQAIKKFKPAVFAFSIVHYISGIKIDLGFIQQLKQDFPDLLLIADGTQYCGTETFDFENSGIDIFIASGYKWMLAGYGNGFVFLNDRVIPHLYADVRHRPRPTEPFVRDKSYLSLYFEPGHLDTLAFGSLQQSIKFFEKMGVDLIQDQVKTIAAKAKEAFAERDLLQRDVVSRKEHSSIFNLAGDDVLFQKLLSEKIVCLQRGKGIRMGFHFFNTEADLINILEVVDGH